VDFITGSIKLSLGWRNRPLYHFGPLQSLQGLQQYGFWVIGVPPLTNFQVYNALLVFLTQKLAMNHNIKKDQTLTTTHDIIASWGGLGSALVTLANQFSTPASIFGTLQIVAYLGCITFLHIATPAIISVQAFNNTVSSRIGVHGLPEFNASNSG
jgi:hypothetical protein